MLPKFWGVKVLIDPTHNLTSLVVRETWYHACLSWTSSLAVNTKNKLFSSNPNSLPHTATHILSTPKLGCSPRVGCLVKTGYCAIQLPSYNSDPKLHLMTRPHIILWQFQLSIIQDLPPSYVCLLSQSRWAQSLERSTHDIVTEWIFQRISPSYDPRDWCCATLQLAPQASQSVGTSRVKV